MFIGNINYVLVAVVGGLRVASGRAVARRRAGVHPVLPAVQPAAHPGGQHGQPAAVRGRLGRAGVRTARRGRSRSPTRRAGPARPGPRRGRVRARVVPLRPGHPADRGPVADRRAGPDGGHRRADRGGQDHAGQPADAVLRGDRRPDHAGRGRHRHDDPGRAARHDRAWCCRTPGCSAARSPTTSPTARHGATREQVIEAAQATHVDRFVAHPAGRLRHRDRRGGRRASARARSSSSRSPGRSWPSRRS